MNAPTYNDLTPAARIALLATLRQVIADTGSTLLAAKHAKHTRPDVFRAVVQRRDGRAALVLAGKCFAAARRIIKAIDRGEPIDLSRLPKSIDLSLMPWWPAMSPDLTPSTN
jgi:hypothetical protein